MNRLTYREGDRHFPTNPVQSIRAEKVMDIILDDQTPGRNVLEGLAFDEEGRLFVCVPVQGKVLRVDLESQTIVQTIGLPDHMLPAALKVHADGRLFVASVTSDHGSEVAVLSPEGELQKTIPMPEARHVDDLVFDSKGGFYLSDLSGHVGNPCAGILYVEPDEQTVRTVIECGLIKSNGIGLTPDESGLWFTEFGAGKLNKIQFGADVFSGSPFKTFVPYYFKGLEGPDSLVVDEDGNVYVAMTGQGRYLVFNAMGMPIGEILIPEREAGHMLKSTHITIKPGTDVAYLCTADMATGDAAIYRAGAYARPLRLG